ncbi:MAG: hypothetical protein K8U57_40595 [Planctomycetes bacterium]|nr:hypothetical protein [Planctomycetota bacterium]
MRFPRRLPTLPSKRHVLAVLLLVAHAFVATGAPVPTPHSASRNKSSAPYPCRDHLCGCFSAEQCWAGDCCCFTLEQKLTWADARGIEPPGHVRSAVEERAKHTPKPKRPCCKGESESPPATDANCERTAGNDTDDSASLQWVVGIFTQKCRGEGLAGLLKLEPTAPPAIPVETFTGPEPDGFVAVFTFTIPCASDCPPIRPPRLGD